MNSELNSATQYINSQVRHMEKEIDLLKKKLETVESLKTENELGSAAVHALSLLGDTTKITNDNSIGFLNVYADLKAALSNPHF